MTVVAIDATGDVRRILAGCSDAVMTGPACAEYLRMVNCKHRRKNIGCMAVFADIAGLNVSDVLADCLNAIVTIDTVA